MPDAALRIAFIQQDFTVGDIDGNVEKILIAYKQACKENADLAIFPEMATTGYPPEDLVLRPSFQEAASMAIATLREATIDQATAMLVGGLDSDEGQIFNTGFLLENGAQLYCQRKVALPNYGVFDEKRLFTPGALPQLFTWRDIKLGLFICEDIWDDGFCNHVIGQKPDLMIALNASPYEMGKAKRRRDRVSFCVGLAKVPLLYLNIVGGQDELVFDGRSFAVSHEDVDICRMLAFSEELAITEWQKHNDIWQCINAPMQAIQDNLETIYQALVLGLRDYVEKNRFPGVVLGFSGGIDSGLSAAVAVDALGADRVHGVMMPSPHTSKQSLEDAAQCAKLLGITYDTIPITPGMQAFDTMLKKIFTGLPKDTTEENIQARLRGNILMALSNKFGHMVLTTGNKSEMSVGYATLYGDMCGGYSVLKDVYKTTVYKLSQWRNQFCPKNGLGSKGIVIPQSMLTKAPTAELRPNQTDQDTLPPYEVLDGILQALVERKLGVDAVVAQGFDRETVVKVLRMLTRAEYKRRQAPPGVKVTFMSFGRDWRYPITNRFKN